MERALLKKETETLRIIAQRRGSKGSYLYVPGSAVNLSIPKGVSNEQLHETLERYRQAVEREFGIRKYEIP